MQVVGAVIKAKYVVTLSKIYNKLTLISWLLNIVHMLGYFIENNGLDPCRMFHYIELIILLFYKIDPYAYECKKAPKKKVVQEPTSPKILFVQPESSRIFNFTRVQAHIWGV